MNNNTMSSPWRSVAPRNASSRILPPRADRFSPADSAADPPFWQDAAILVSTFFMWASVYLNLLIYGNPDAAGLFSFSTTRFVILPLLVYDFIKRPQVYRPVMGWGIFASLLTVSFAYPLLSNGTAIGHLLPYGVSFALFLYFIRGRSFGRIIDLLKIAALCAGVVPLMQFLGSLNLIPILKGGDEAFNQGAEGRVFSVTRTATVGVYSLYIVASMGGLLFLSKSWVARSWSDSVIRITFAFSFVLAVIAPLYAVQRASIIPVLGVSVFSLFLLLRRNKKLFVAVIPLLFVGIGVFYFIIYGRVAAFYDLAITRFSGVTLGSLHMMEGSAYFRLAELQIFWADSWIRGLFVAPGVMAFYSRVGSVPHTFIGQAFYDGGLIFLTLVILMYFVIVYRFLSFLFKRVNPLQKAAGFAMGSVCIGNIFISCFLPILQEPLVWISVAFFLLLSKDNLILEQPSTIPRRYA